MKMEYEQQKFSEAVSMYYSYDRLKFVITLNSIHIDYGKFITRSFVIRGLKLHELKAVVEENDAGYLPGICIVEDLIITFRYNNVLCVSLGSIKGNGINERIPLNDADYDQFRFMVNRLAK